MIVNVPLAVVIVIGNVPAKFSCAAVKVVAPIVNDFTPPGVPTEPGAAKMNVPVKVSPIPTALVPTARSDSSTLPSVPAMAPSSRPTMAGTPTTLITMVDVSASPSPSVSW